MSKRLFLLFVLCIASLSTATSCVSLKAPKNITIGGGDRHHKSDRDRKDRDDDDDDDRDDDDHDDD
ncbi:MAG TPA: hypothetical protein P5081_15280 [Phycisphaerae bacterium]|nr:hypothetical protein [Phycisphaerae bacterium]HRW54233.1 hypothetical protein [Phycisphaerae bacterium]